MIKLDEIDRRILQLLQRNNQLSNLELAEEVRISPSTCLKRVRRLREELIIADVALLDPALVDRKFFVLIEIVLERQNEQLQRAFEKQMERTDEVMQCYMVSGQADFIIVVQVADMDAYHRFVRRTLTSDPNVRNFRSFFAMNRSKFRTEISLEET